MEERIRGSWWLAPPGNWRRFQITMAGLVVLGLFGLAAGIAAAAFGQPPGDVLLIGVGTPLVAEFVLFGIPVRVAGEARFTLPATPERLFTIASDPQMMVRLSPAGLRLIQSSGEAGHVGSRFVMTASGLRMAIRVLRSDPPREIVIEVRSRLTRAVTTRTYTPVGDGTEVWMRTQQRIPLGAWLLRPVFRSEVSYTMAEGRRRLLAFLEADSTVDR